MTLADHRPDVFKVLGCESRLRILHALLKSSTPITIHRLTLITWLDRKVIRKHLPALEYAGYVKQTVGIDGNGHEKPTLKYEANRANPTVLALQEFIRELELERLLPMIRNSELNGELLD